MKSEVASNPDNKTTVQPPATVSSTRVRMENYIKQLKENSNNLTISSKVKHNASSVPINKTIKTSKEVASLPEQKEKTTKSHKSVNSLTNKMF